MAKKQQESPFTGRWLFVSLDAWDIEDDGEPAYIEFDDHGSGEFRFACVHGELDGRVGTRGDEPAIEWTWEGNDEMDPVMGRGWAVRKGDELHGMIFFHQGDDSGFVAKKATAKKATKRK